MRKSNNNKEHNRNGFAMRKAKQVSDHEPNISYSLNNELLGYDVDLYDNRKNTYVYFPQFAHNPHTGIASTVHTEETSRARIGRENFNNDMNNKFRSEKNGEVNFL
tara:strand:+ start:58 stop:375 length:318 start_codon:yes stop_codon:yes gene_type:complete